MLKQEKILKLIKIFFFLRVSFNLKKIYILKKKKKVYFTRFLFKKFRKKFKKKFRKITKRLVYSGIRHHLNNNFYELFIDKYFKSKMKKVKWFFKKRLLKISRFKLKRFKKLSKYFCNSTHFTNYFIPLNYYKIKKFDFFIKKKLKIKFKNFKSSLSYVIKKNNFYYLFYIYLNKKLIYIKNAEDFKKNTYRLKRVRTIMRGIIIFYLIKLAKLHKIKIINLTFFMKKRTRLNKKKYKKVTKTALEPKVFKNFFKTYTILKKKLDKSCGIKFKFIYTRRHSKRTEKLKKKKRR